MKLRPAPRLRLVAIALVAIACHRPSTSAQAHGQAPQGGDAGTPDASRARLAACRGQPGGEAQLLELVGRCAGLAPGPGLSRVLAVAGGTIVRISDASAQASALAWAEVHATGTRVIALSVTAPDSSVAVALRLEQLQGQEVLVEQLRTGCNAEALHWPQRAAPIGLGAISPRFEPGCPRLVERVSRRRGDSFEPLGAYAIAGVQQLSTSLSRRFSSRVAFDAEGVRVTDRAEWLWLGNQKRDRLWEETYRGVAARASSDYERRYHLEGAALIELTEAEPMPKATPSHGEKVLAAAPNDGAPCAPR
jgi:hypothetical protein